MRNWNLQNQFNKKWTECYRSLKLSNKPFGFHEQLQIRYTGNFCIIKNNEYKNKRATNTIDKALQQKVVTLPFLKEAFNFNKISLCQILYAIDFDEDGWYDTSFNESNRHFIIINGCPILQSHALFIPLSKENHPQIMTSELLDISLQMASTLPNMKFGFNSQGAASSVNHFHLQMLSLDKILPKNKFSFEHVNGKLLISKDNIQITYFSLHQAHYFKLFSLQRLLKKKQQVNIFTMRIIDYLLNENIPHNIVITDINTIYVIVRGYANQQYKYGWLEYSGVIIAKSQEQFQVDDITIQTTFQKIQNVPQDQINRLLILLKDVI